MGVHFVPLLAAGAVGALLAKGTNKNEKGLLYNAAVDVTAYALDIRDSIEQSYEDIIEEAESKVNKDMVDIDIE